MKIRILATLLMLGVLLIGLNAFAGNGNVYVNGQLGVGTTTPDPSSALHLNSTTQGMIPPRMTTAQRNAIALPADGLFIYNTDTGQYQYYNKNAGSWSSVGGSPVGQCRLVLSGANLLLKPYQGNQITIQGANYSIPSAGINPDTTPLTPGTLYYVYAYNGAGTVKMEVSTIGHVTDAAAGNVGVEVKSGDNSRSLVGMAYYTAGSAWGTGLQVASWFNRQNLSAYNYFTAARFSSVTAATEINSEIRVPFVTWATESVGFSIQGYSSYGAVGGGVYTYMAFDTSVLSIFFNYYTATAASYAFPIGISGQYSLNEGYHYGTIYGASANASYAAAWATPTSLSISIRG